MTDITGKDEYTELFRELEMQKTSLQKQLSLGIIDLVDAAEERDMIKKKEFAVKKQLVDKVHVTKGGRLRSITSHDATESYPEGYVYTKLEGGKLIKGKDIATLYDRLYDIYYGKGVDDRMSVLNIFNEALDEKSATENPKSNTVMRYRYDFDRFISDEMKKRSVLTLSGLDLAAYTQELVNSLSMKKKSFLAYKGVLNLIFGYCMRHELITSNPVSSINNRAYLKSCDTSRARMEDKILSPEEIKLLTDEIDRRMGMEKWGPYYINGYAAKFAMLTGVRVGELCAVRWDDIDFDSHLVYIHSQQLTRIVDGKKEYYLVPYTKNERGISEEGRLFPLTDGLKALLMELKGKQGSLGIVSDFVFCKEDGSMIKTNSYITFLRRLCRHVGLTVTNNHALRMSLNSNVLIPKGISTTDRAALLGHSVETNLKYYSFADKDYLEKARNILNGDIREPFSSSREPFSTLKFEKKKSLRIGTF